MNKKLLKIGSSISMLNFTAPIVANATTYRSLYTSGRILSSSRTIVM